MPSPLGTSVDVYGYASYYHVLTINGINVPQKAALEGYTLNEHVLAVDGRKRLGTVERAAFLAVAQTLFDGHTVVDVVLNYAFAVRKLAHGHVHRRPHNHAFARKGYVLCAVGIYKRTGTHNLDALMAREHGRLIVVYLARELYHGTFIQAKLHVALQFYSA